MDRVIGQRTQPLRDCAMLPAPMTAQAATPPPELIRLQEALRQDGHLRLDGPATAGLLRLCAGNDALDVDWSAFAACWDDLPLDGYLADGGRYRRRRHANFQLGPDGEVRRQSHRPHYQSRDYNPLHGGIERWFEPMADTMADGVTLRAVLRFCHRMFAPLSPQVRDWFVETHPFRVEAFDGEAGLPTPEGVHRDGVDWVFVMLVRRENVRSGVTSIHGPDGTELGSFTLTQPMDAVLIDDHRVHHGVTPVEPVDPLKPAWRDVLVVTFRAA